MVFITSYKQYRQKRTINFMFDKVSCWCAVRGVLRGIAYNGSACMCSEAEGFRTLKHRKG